jgi:uncharacterized spore protein YtfJ
MTLETVLDRARDVGTVRRAFGDPYEKDGITVIPAASVQGGGGGGEGPQGQGGTGGGFGGTARPAGAFVIQDGTVRWQPAVDVNRVLALGVVALLVIRSIVRTRAKTKRTLAALARRDS